VRWTVDGLRVGPRSAASRRGAGPGRCPVHPGPTCARCPVIGGGVSWTGLAGTGFAGTGGGAGRDGHGVLPWTSCWEMVGGSALVESVGSVAGRAVDRALREVILRGARRGARDDDGAVIRAVVRAVVGAIISVVISRGVARGTGEIVGRPAGRGVTCPWASTACSAARRERVDGLMGRPRRRSGPARWRGRSRAAW